MATFADAVGVDALEPQLEAHRPALTGYCYRMLGSWFEAEDAVQETMVRAWKGADRLEARGALKSWLYRIATNVSLDMLQGSGRRALAMDLMAPVSAEGPPPMPLADSTWLEPAPSARIGIGPGDGGDPAAVAAGRESLRLAFIAALQHLPPRQRAVLVLRDVLRWRAAEAAELLDTTVVSVNSALQRARATLDELDLEEGAGATAVDDAEQAQLLDAYVDAFEAYDVDRLVALLREDASFSMPPHPMWLQGPREVRAWMLGHGIGCRGSRVLRTTANGMPAAATYRRAPDGGWTPWAIAVLEVDAEGRLSGIHNFLDKRLFEAFGLPPRLPAA